MTAEAYIQWFSKTMSTRVEPKFQIESWRKETIEKRYQAGLIGILQKFDGHSEEIIRDFINNYSHTSMYLISKMIIKQVFKLVLQSKRVSA